MSDWERVRPRDSVCPIDVSYTVRLRPKTVESVRLAEVSGLLITCLIEGVL